VGVYPSSPETADEAATQRLGGQEKMTLKRILSSLSMITLATGIVFAQSPAAKVAHTKASGVITPASKAPSGTRNIWSNFGPTTTDYYNDTTGYYLLGPDNSVGLDEQWIGVPFTPHVNATVTNIEVGAQYETGTNKFTVALYDDNDGVAGSPLASATGSNAPDFGTCCQTVTVAITPTAVSQGVQYWIVVTSDDTIAADFTGVFVAANTADISADVGLEGWFSFTTNTPAAAVRGTVP
jgi:hypothetical protein